MFALLALGTPAAAQGDPPGVRLSKIILVINEGSSATYDVWLNSQPTADVTITLESRNTIIATVSPATLTFTPTAWNDAARQTVTVTAVENDIDDRDPGPPPDAAGRTQITHTVAGGNYDSVTVPDLAVDKLNNDQRGIVRHTRNREGDLQRAGAIAMGEGWTRSYFVSLATEPWANTRVEITNTDPTVLAAVSPTALDFTPSDWNLPQEVMVTVVENDVDEQSNATRKAQVRINHAFTGPDSDYDGYPAGGMAVNVYDRDVDMTVTPTALTLKAGETGTYTVMLDSEPLRGEVEVALRTTSADNVVTVHPSSLTFLRTAWATPQTVQVTAVSGGGATISHRSSPAAFDEVHGVDVAVNVVGAPALPFQLAEPTLPSGDADMGSQLIFQNNRIHKNFISVANTSENQAVTVLVQYYNDVLELVLWYLRVFPPGSNVLIDPYDHRIPGTDPPTNVGEILANSGSADSGRFVIAVTAVGASVGVDGDGAIDADEGNGEKTANVLFPAFLVKDAARGVNLHGVGNIDHCGVLTRTIPDSLSPDTPPINNLEYTENGNDGVFDCRTDDPRTAVDETDRTSRNVGDLSIENARPIAFNHLTGHFTETLLPVDSWGGTPVIRPAVGDTDDLVDYQVLNDANVDAGGRLAEVAGGGTEVAIVNTVSGYANRGDNFEDGTPPGNDTSQGGKIRNTAEDSPRRQRGLNGGALALTALYRGGDRVRQIVRLLSVADEYGEAGKYRLVAAKTAYRVTLMDSDGDALPIPAADPPPVFGGAPEPETPPGTKIIVDGIRIQVDADDCEGTLIDGSWSLSALTRLVPTAVSGAQDFDGLDADVDPMRNASPGWIAFVRTGLKCERDFGDGDSAVGSSVEVADGIPATDRRTFQAGSLLIEEKDTSRTFVTSGRAVVQLITPGGAFAASWPLIPLPAN